ncbi:SGNH/GDSL hydrolase family protein [Microbacterium hominis]|uniref:SGNH/GDSL hydrolase family protein n=1 Tax=Microbacterium hominis TaxID=162426 RepID=A0A7D4U8U7_9MICO|nr:SGNH/GDSL hydrolase family protein [Microbacterium hominis]QKJ20286.1 SGNH/GDSL hydrolase family protein [Microbacterium hominis]
MTRTARTSRRALTALTAFAVSAALLIGCAAAAPEPGPVDLSEIPAAPGLSDVTVVGALGDSISLGVNACAEPGHCSAASWATGDDPAVGSVAMRIGEVAGAFPEVVNKAKDGGTVADALARVDEVIAADPGLVLILLGGNDVCDADVSGMTTVDNFRIAYGNLLAKIHEALPDTQILAMSIPDLYRLWEIGHVDATAVGRWDQSPSCRNLLGDAQAIDEESVARRDAVALRTQELNAVIAEVCTAEVSCVSDGGAVYAYEFAPDQISSIDYFHPSVAGEQAIAELAWNALQEAAT